MTALDDNVYILGGVVHDNDYNITTQNTVEYYRIQDETWHVAAPFPEPLNHMNAAGVDGQLFLLGGLSGGSNWTVRGQSYVYHPSNDSWTDIAPMPNGTARGSCAVGVYDGTIYLAGGMSR